MTVSAEQLEPRLCVKDLQIAPLRRRREATMRALFMACAALSIVVSAAIIVSLIGNALTFALQVDPAALVSGGWFPRRGMYDIATILAGTLVISAIGMLVAAPLGIGAAIYLSEYASRGCVAGSSRCSRSSPRSRASSSGSLR